LIVKQSALRRGQGYDLLLYGASIFENWRGTAVGITWRNSQGIVEAYNSTFPNHYRTDVLAVSGTRSPSFANGLLCAGQAGKHAGERAERAAQARLGCRLCAPASHLLVAVVGR